MAFISFACQDKFKALPGIPRQNFVISFKIMSALTIES